MKLSSDQVEVIQKRIERSGIHIESLRDDILDHLCCVIEIELDKATCSFNDAMDKAIFDLAPNGLRQLEKETVYLLNSKKIIRMKKLMYFIGFIGAVSFTIGFVFRLLHMPGADQLWLVGNVLLFLIFIPLAAIDRYKVTLSKAISEQLRIILGAASAIAAGLAGVFKVYHLQGFDFLLFTATVLFAAGFLPFLFFTMYKKSIS